MISSSSSFASSNSSRAAGCSRIAGYLPFSSQARKKNCQSISSRSRRRSGSMSRVPVNDGTARSSKLSFSRLACACHSGSSGRRCFCACSVRSRSCSARLAWSSSAERTGSSRSDTTPTTREASSTCTVGWS